jgi:hypothetical protein
VTVAERVRLVAELSAIGIGVGALMLVVVAQGADEQAAMIKEALVVEVLAPSITPTTAVP